MAGNTDFHLDKVLKHIEELAYLHRACTQIMAGWNVKVAELDVKLGMARHAFESMEQSSRLDRHVWSLTRVAAHDSRVSLVTRDMLSAVDCQHYSGDVIAALYLFITPRLKELYVDLLPELHGIWDGAIARTAQDYLPLLERQIVWGEERIGAYYARSRNAAVLADLGTSWPGRNEGPTIDRAQAIWQPLDRAPRAARSDDLPLALPGSMRLIPANPWTDPDGIGLAMHNQMHGEFTTMELMSRCLYEHPDMPSAFHLDMARHASDEARHASIFADLAEQYGVKYGDYPVYTLSYEGYYDFAPVCEMGSRDELLWRLLLRGTIDEGLALDDLEFQTNSRRHLDQNHIAEACRYIMADETFHVQGALKWTRYLCSGKEEKVMLERDRARQFYELRLRERRWEFEQEHGEEVQKELAYRRGLAEAEDQRPNLPFQRRLNSAARIAAGYTDEDLQQIVDWGYIRG